LLLWGGRPPWAARLGRWWRLLRRYAAAENRPEAVQESAGRRRLLGVQPGFELLQPFIGRTQGLVLDDDGLRQEIGRIRHGLDGIGNQSLGLRVARRVGCRADAIEETCDELAFFG
jgi:hypothetical protein